MNDLNTGMKANHIQVFTAILLVHATACVDPISFDTDTESGQLVFYGVFTQINKTHLFAISKTTSLGNPTEAVNGARVMIHDSEGNSASYQEKTDGLYELSSEDMIGVPGRSYYLEITLDNGVTYCSVPQEMPQAIEIADLFFKVEQEQYLSSTGNLVEQTFINIFIDTPLENVSGELFALRWEIEETYSFTDLPCHPFYDPSLTCYFQIPNNDPSINFFQSNGTETQLNGYKVFSRILAPDDQFVERHYFSVFQYTLTPTAYDYWERVSMVANQSGDILDTPPARIVGNIFSSENPEQPALGYFQVSGMNIKRVYTLPYLIGENMVLSTCPPTRNFIMQDKCCFCYLLDQPDNRIERPDYWGD